MFEQVKQIIRALQGPSRQDRERAYLNAAVSAVDLEYRQREIDAGRFRERVALY